MIDKVLCPWCGSEMHYSAKVNISTHKYEGSMRCEKCGATSPMVVSREEPDLTSFKGLIACAALRRYEPPCRPLTEEEVRKHFEGKDASPVWVQYSNPIVMTSGWRGFNFIATMFPLPDEIYGKTWRCWPRKPTEEERKEAKWDDD